MRRTTTLLSLLTFFCCQAATTGPLAASGQLLVSVTVSSPCQTMRMISDRDPATSTSGQWSLSFSCPDDLPQQIRVGSRESGQILTAPKHIKGQENQAIVISQAILTAAQGVAADADAPLILTIDY